MLAEVSCQTVGYISETDTIICTNIVNISHFCVAGCITRKTYRKSYTIIFLLGPEYTIFNIQREN